MVITSALHAEGRQFEPGRNHAVFIYLIVFSNGYSKMINCLNISVEFRVTGEHVASSLEITKIARN